LVSMEGTEQQIFQERRAAGSKGLSLCWKMTCGSWIFAGAKHLNSLVGHILRE
jgi:hypothetical protein